MAVPMQKLAKCQGTFGQPLRAFVIGKQAEKRVAKKPLVKIIFLDMLRCGMYRRNMYWFPYICESDA